MQNPARAAGLGRPTPADRTPEPQRIALVRRTLLESLSESDSLIVLHAGCFDDPRGLVDTWLKTGLGPTPGAADSDSGSNTTADATTVARVPDPQPGITAPEYWSQLHQSLHDRHPGHACGTDEEPFDALYNCLATLPGQAPVLLILDDLHLVPQASSRVEELLANPPSAGLRIIVTTHVDEGWSGRLTRAPGRRYVPPSAFQVESTDIADLLRSMRIEHDIRTPDLIRNFTGGLCTLTRTVCETLPVGEFAEPRHLATYIPPMIDTEVERVISSDPDLAARRVTVLLSGAVQPLTRETIALAAGVAGEEQDQDDDDNTASTSRSGSSDPVSLLEFLEPAGLAQATEDPTGRQWTYPDLVRDSLVRMAERDNPDELAEYRNRLIEFWLSTDRPSEALKTAVAASAWNQAVDILSAHITTLFARDFATAAHDNLLLEIPEEVLADHPGLTKLRAVQSRLEKARLNTGASPGRLAAPDPSTPLSGASLHEYALGMAGRRADGHYAEAADAADHITAAIESGPAPVTDKDRDVAAFLSIHLGNSFLLAGRFADALTAFHRSFKHAVEPFIQRDAAGKLALTYALVGRNGEATEWLAEERRHPALPTSAEMLVRPAGDVAAALLASDRLDLESAHHVLTDLGSPEDREEFWGFILYARARTALLSDNPGHALRSLESEALRFSRQPDGGGVTEPMLEAAHADLFLACDRVDAAAELWSGSAFTHSPLTAASRARTLLLSNRPVEAMEVVAAALSDLRTITRSALELEVVGAAAALAMGDVDRARRLLRNSLEVYRASGSLGSFVGLPAKVVRRLATLAPELPAPLVDSRPEFGTLTFAAVTSANGTTAAAPALTEREFAVLRDLATNATIREIAEQSYLSPNTVKTQIKSLYRKLGVNSRAAAVTTAHSWNLV